MLRIAYHYTSFFQNLLADLVRFIRDSSSDIWFSFVSASRFPAILGRPGCALVVLLTVLTVQADSAWAAESPIRISEIEIGIDGHFRVGCHAPIEFTVQLRESATEGSDWNVEPRIRAVDPDGHAVCHRLPPIELSAEPTRVRGRFRSGKLEAPITIELLRDDQLIASQTIRMDHTEERGCLRQDAHIWLVVGEHPGFTAAASLFESHDPEAIHVAHRDDLLLHLSDARALDSVTLVVINADVPVDSTTAEALRDWVRRGGTLALFIGDQSRSLSASPLATWLPTLPQGTIELRNLNSLNTFVPGSEPLRMLGSLPAAQVRSTQGHVLAADLGNPLLLRDAYGRGVVVLSSVAMDQKPLSNWTARADFALKLVGIEAPWKSAASNSNQSFDMTGVTDLQTQLIHTLDVYETVDRPSYWVVIGFCAVCLLIVGPLDFFLLHRVLKRPQLTWVTLPIWLMIMTSWALSSATKTNQVGESARQLDLVDIDVSNHTISGRSWFDFYSAATQRNSISTSVLLPVRQDASTKTQTPQFLTTSWVERPETSYRGMYRTGGLDAGKPKYRLSSDDRAIEGYPTRVWSTGLVATEWETAIDAQRWVQSNLHDPGNGRLTGHVTYLGPGEISQWFVAYGDFAYFPRSRAGQDQAPLLTGDRFELRSARSNLLRGVLVGLTHTSIFDEQLKTEALVNRENYDPMSRNPYTIFRILSFHEVTGGTGYTGLRNDSLADADLSRLLSLRRAVLFGRLQKPLTDWSLNDHAPAYTQQEAFVRLILPVQYQQADLNAPPDPTLLKAP